MKVELSKEGEGKELAQIQMYKPGKKGATILLTSSKGDSFEVVKIIADKFIEVFLKAFLKGLIKGDTEMKTYEVHQESILKNVFDCDNCDRKFSTKQGLGTHMAWHTKKTKAETPSQPDVPVTQTETKQISFQKTLQQSKCMECDQLFTADHKYQTIQQLLTHKKICINKIQLINQYRTKRECDECGYSAKNEKDLMNHNRDDHLNLSTSASPPPKKKRSLDNDNIEKENICMLKELSFRVEHMDIFEKEEDKEDEIRKRSIWMDQKVENIKRKRKEEEIAEIERRKKMNCRKRKKKKQGK